MRNDARREANSARRRGKESSQERKRLFSLSSKRTRHTFQSLKSRMKERVHSLEKRRIDRAKWVYMNRDTAQPGSGEASGGHSRQLQAEFDKVYSRVSGMSRDRRVESEYSVGGIRDRSHREGRMHSANHSDMDTRQNTSYGRVKAEGSKDESGLYRTRISGKEFVPRERLWVEEMGQEEGTASRLSRSYKQSKDADPHEPGMSLNKPNEESQSKHVFSQLEGMSDIPRRLDTRGSGKDVTDRSAFF